MQRWKTSAYFVNCKKGTLICMMNATGSYKNILSLALPITFGAIAQNIILATDALFMAGVDEVALDAVGIAGLFYSTLFTLGFGFSIGVQILIARRHGEKKNEAIGDIFNTSFQFLVLTGLILWIFMEWAGPFLIEKMIKSGPVCDSAIIYLNERDWGILFLMANLSFRALYLGLSNSKVVTWATIVTALANVILNYVLIFGHIGFSKMGIAGAGLASSLSEIIGFIFFIVRSGKIKNQFGLQIFKRWKLRAEEIVSINKIAAPMMMQNFVSHSGWFIFFIIIEQLGVRALAVSVLIRIIYMFQMAPFWGLSAATNTLVSFSIGENQQDSVLSILRRISGIAIFTSLLISIPNFFFPDWVISLALNGNNQGGLIQDSIPVLRVISIALILFSVSMVYFSGVTGSGNTKFGLLLECFVIVCYVILAAFLGSLNNIDVAIVWLVEPFYFFLIGLISYLYMAKGRFKNKKI